jgi:hypothetical protein
MRESLSRGNCWLPSAAWFTLLLSGCGAGGAPTPSEHPAPVQDDTDAVQSAVDHGGLVSFAARTYHLSRTIVITQSNTTIEGLGPQTVFQFRASATRQHCVNDRAFTTPCGIDDNPPRRIAGAIAVGARSFTAAAAADTADLLPGDWLLITDADPVIGDRVAGDWAQVDAVVGTVISVRTPFRTAFTTARSWDPGRSGLGFQLLGPVVQNTEFRNFSISVPDAGSGTAAVGISVYAALHTIIDHVSSTSFAAQPLYSRFAKDLTITDSSASGHGVLSEFATTVDLTIRGTSFSEQDAAAMGLDLGTAFFEVADNDLEMSSNVGAYLLYGVHDGTFEGNRLAFVDNSDAAVGAFGLLLWGVQNVTVSSNYLAGGAGPDSTGISVRDIASEIAMPAIDVSLSGNIFGAAWVRDYEPGTHPQH